MTAVQTNNLGRSGWPIWGHASQVESLAQAVELGRVRHAYLFSGPDGIGKTALAVSFAKALNCSQPAASGVPCGECRSCGKIDRGVHPDVQTYSLKSQEASAERKGTKNTTLTIETVRELCAATALRPMEGRWRVILVEDAETMQGVAQEALLKTLEEPPQFMVLILLADDGELLLPTIRSRCQIVELRPVGHATVVEGLVELGVPAEKADEIAALAAGRPGWARRAAKDPKLLGARGESISQAVTWIEANGYQRLVTAVRLGDGFAQKQAETFANLETLLGVWRDLLLLVSQVPDYLSNRGFEERMRELARSWTMAEIHRAVRAVQTCISDLESNVRPRLAMEAMVLQWPKTPDR